MVINTTEILEVLEEMKGTVNDGIHSEVPFDDDELDYLTDLVEKDLLEIS